MVVDDFDIGWSFLFPFEADSELVVDPDAVLTGTLAFERLQSIAAKGGKIPEGQGCVQPYQPGASLILDRNQLNNTLVVQKLLRPRVFERGNQPYMILLHR
jgi:hypothetical protein